MFEGRQTNCLIQIVWCGGASSRSKTVITRVRTWRSGTTASPLILVLMGK